jgi:DNA-binding IclR family transcriptional regulator
MRWMERKSHATVILSVIQSNRKFIIDYADTEQNFFFDHTTIRTDDIYRTATGRAILSHMDRGEIERIWEKYGKPPLGH